VTRGELADLQREGKIEHIGLSEVTIAQLQAAQAITPVVTVQNMFYLVARRRAASRLQHRARDRLHPMTLREDDVTPE
jgi:pyridoxine 4-dehydrogenase